jgi:glycosyltransferase involved in cell wall biosynthesis
MKVSGFTLIYNGITLGFPYIESIKSLAPLCDEVIINVGFSDPECTQDDGTWELLQKELNDEKYDFIKSYWDPKIKKDGLILSQQTNIALEKCSGDLAFYLQGDEVLHEQEYSLIKEEMKRLFEDPDSEGVVFNYIHFYGNTDIVKHTRNTYRRELRLLKNLPTIRSIKDAQGFRHQDGTKIKCFQTKAHVFHYGWAREQEIMNRKAQDFDKLYHGENHQSKNFRYQRIWGLKPFQKSHPKVMDQWIKKNKNDLDIMSLPLNHEWKNIGLCLSDWLENLTGYRIGEYKNFKIIK